MRVKRIQQRFGDLREIVIQLVVDAATQQCEGFDEPFHMRIFGNPAPQHEATRHARILIRELRRHLPNEIQFALVVWQQLVSQAFPPETETRRESR